MKIYSSLTRKKEEFIPIVAKEVKMYACGITPYDEVHIGHARQAIVYDVIRSYFEFLGYNVTYIRNFTDIDDKIIKRAKNEGKDSKDISEYFIRENTRDIESLKVRRGTFEPKVTECINDIISFIKVLVEKGYAYVANGEVLFDIDKFVEYGKLSNRKKDELINTEESSNKRHGGDFVLWKPKKEGEPYWSSPWSDGRPGWHIECSVMAYKYLGETIDIHGGGLDLLFPHHENEIAQSEAYSGKKFANYWLHNGLVMVNGGKMGKSLGNFMTIKDALAKYFPEEIRFAILSHSIGTEIDFSKELFLNARKRLYYFYTTIEKMRTLIGGMTEIDVEVPEKIMKLKKKFTQLMDDNFNTQRVIAEITEVFKELNSVINSNTYSIGQKTHIIQEFFKTLSDISAVLHLFEEDATIYLHQLRSHLLSNAQITEKYIQLKIEERSRAKADKNWLLSDQIKKELLDKGVALQDSSSGTKWDIVL